MALWETPPTGFRAEFLRRVALCLSEGEGSSPLSLVARGCATPVQRAAADFCAAEAQQDARLRADIAAARAAWRRTRAALDAPTATELDDELWRQFNNLGDSPRERLAEVQALVERGAGTAAFVDHELGCRCNVAKYVQSEFLPSPDEEKLRMLMKVAIAGDAFHTNREYVGNGGESAVFRIIYALRDLKFRSVAQRPSSVGLWLRLLRSFLAAMAQQTLRMSLTEYFFLVGAHEFQGPRHAPRALLRVLVRREGFEATLRHCQQLACYPDLYCAAVEAAKHQGDAVADSAVVAFISRNAGSLFSSPGLAAAALAAASASGAGCCLVPPLDEPQAEMLLNQCCRDRQGRAQLARAFSGEPVRSWLSASLPLLRSLTRRREHRLLVPLLGGIPAAHLQDLLEVACSSRGKAERVVELLLESGAKAEGAAVWEAARRRRKKAVMGALGVAAAVGGHEWSS